MRLGKRVFDFGANWRSYSLHVLDVQRVEEARKSLVELLGGDGLAGRTFVDVGCGSGLFAIAASQAGAARVVGLDLDPRCIEVARENQKRFGAEAVSFLAASILNREAIRPLGTFDVVYAWGSLHHTGKMREAVATVLEMTSPGGELVLAIYNAHFTSPVWRGIKWLYNVFPGSLRAAMNVGFVPVIFLAKLLVTQRNPLKKDRGMDFFHDVVDWIGGYPYEYAPPDAVRQLVEPNGFSLKRFLPADTPTGCNQFVFTRNGGAIESQ